MNYTDKRTESIIKSVTDGCEAAVKSLNDYVEYLKEQEATGANIHGNDNVNWPHGQNYKHECGCGEKYRGPKGAFACWPCVAEHTKQWWLTIGPRQEEARENRIMQNELERRWRASLWSSPKEGLED